MAVAAHSPAVPYNWHNVVIGGGGFSPNIIFSPVEKGLAYLRTDVGGAYRWDARLQRWIPLEDDIWNDSYYGIESIAPDPKDPNIVYVAAGMYAWAPAAIMRSNDRGAHWDIIPVAFKMGGNEDGRGMGERLAVDPERTSTLFFGSRHDGLWQSDDRAKTWRKVESFPWHGLGTPAPKHTHGGLSWEWPIPRRTICSARLTAAIAGQP
jgi:xyloglucan-specific exo-beta-1,4-glucanase